MDTMGNNAYSIIDRKTSTRKLDFWLFLGYEIRHFVFKLKKRPE